MTAIVTPSLIEYITTRLRGFTSTTTQDYTVQCVQSTPKRSHTLFPHSPTHATTKVYSHEVLLVLSQQSTPTAALEATVYSIPSTQSLLLYISKVDTTGLLASTPTPTALLVQSFISYYFTHPPTPFTRIRLHLFAKSQSQYLFPGSADNIPSKRILSDAQLINWWKNTLTTSLNTCLPGNQERIKLFYVIPGLTYSDSLLYVPASSRPSPILSWIYSHPYSTLPSLLYPSSSSSPTTTYSIGDLVPSFVDDPKARFQASLTSSSVAPAGEPNDYDDVMNSLASTSFVSLTSGLGQRERVELDRTREMKRLEEGVPGGMNEWWERMEWRQECCSGVMVGFFVVDLDLASSSSSSLSADIAPLDVVASANTTTTIVSHSSSPSPTPGAVPHSHFIALWSQFHNTDYSLAALPKLLVAAEKWRNDVKALVLAEGYLPPTSSLNGQGSKSRRKQQDEEAVVVDEKGEDEKRKEKEEEVERKRNERERIYELYVGRQFTIEATTGGAEKRKVEVEEVKVVNKMVPRKKIKKV